MTDSAPIRRPPPLVAEVNARCAAEVVWPRGKSMHRPAVRTERPVRLTALLHGCVGLAVGVGLFLFGPRPLAYIAFSISGGTMLVGLLFPVTGYPQLQRVLRQFGVWVGRLLTVATLVPIFILFFTVFGLLRRRGSRDPMTRRAKPVGGSYWRARTPIGDPLRTYERQF